VFAHQTTRRSAPAPCGSANSTKQPGLSHANRGPDPPTVTISEAKQRELRAIAQRLERTQARYVDAVDRLTAGTVPRPRTGPGRSAAPCLRSGAAAPNGELESVKEFIARIAEEQET
jgi:hypothetical protein